MVYREITGGKEKHLFYSIDKLYFYSKNTIKIPKGSVMGRPLGSKNKSPQELKTEAEMLKKRAEMMELERKRTELANQRRQGVKK